MNPFKQALAERRRAQFATFTDEQRVKAFVTVVRKAQFGAADARERLAELTALSPELAEFAEQVRAQAPIWVPRDFSHDPSPATHHPQDGKQIMHESRRAMEANDAEPAAGLTSEPAKPAVTPSVGDIMNGASPPGLRWSNHLKRLFDRAESDGTSWMGRR
jgi:hypothetical protein